MQSQRRGAPRGAAAEPRDTAGEGRREPDVNRERLVYCCTSLVGHKVTAKLRNNIFYEGLFHSCSLDGDFSITLRCARQLPSDQCRSGEVIGTLVIPGKDFLQVSAVDVPPPAVAEAAGRSGSGAGQAFATDGEIAQKTKWAASSHDRELVAWSGGADAAGPSADTGSLEEMAASRGRSWDQFQANEAKYGITSTYNEDLYTTKLDPQSIPREKREEADRIAREIEAGPMASEVEGRIEAADEEDKFSAVPRGGSYRSSGREVAVPSSAGSGGAAPSAKGAGSQQRPAAAPPSELPAPSGGQVALTKEHLSQHDSWSGSGLPGDGFALEHRTKRGMITAHSPMRQPMVSEMKRINALNLEPALPKLDDKTRNDWISFKQSQTRNTSKSVHGSGLKMEFEQSLQVIQQRTQSKQQEQQQGQQQASSVASAGQTAASPADACGTGRGGASSAMFQRKGSIDGAGAGGGDAGRSKFSFNPAAKEFSFNPQAATFTPGGGHMPGGGPSGAGGMSPQARQQGPTPQFVPASRETQGRGLAEILDRLFERARLECTETVAPDWSEAHGRAVGVSFREVLGRPNPSGPPALPPPAGAAPGTGPGGWQQQVMGQMAPGGGPGQGGGPAAGPGPPMMAGGFLVQTGAPAAGQQGQLGYPQMYAAPAGGVPSQRPSGGGQGGMAQQQAQGGQQVPVGFGPQSMLQPPGSVMVPAGMVATQGGQMGPAPKFGTQVMPVVVPAGQYGPGAFVQGQGPGPGGAQVMMQGQMLMQPMYPGQRMGGGGPSSQMAGHEG